jgi:hypothetical protein
MWWVSKSSGLNWKFQLDLTDGKTNSIIKILIFNFLIVKTSIMLSVFLKKNLLNWKLQLDLTSRNADETTNILIFNFLIVKTSVILSVFL